MRGVGAFACVGGSGVAHPMMMPRWTEDRDLDVATADAIFGREWRVSNERLETPSNCFPTLVDLSLTSTPANAVRSIVTSLQRSSELLPIQSSRGCSLRWRDLRAPSPQVGELLYGDSDMRIQRTTHRDTIFIATRSHLANERPSAVSVG